MTETPATFPNPEITTIIPDMGVECPKTDTDTNNLKKKSINKDIRQKLRNKVVYETDMHKIYNIIVVQR